MDENRIEAQIGRIRKGFPWLQIEAPATPGRGIRVLNASESADAVDYYETHASDVAKCKFVPASGAASRMFKDIFAGMEIANDAVRRLSESLEKFAFYTPEVFGTAPFSPEQTARRLLTDEGLGYGYKPKAVLRFHRVDGVARTPVAEHMNEARMYMKNPDGSATVEFTISPEHRFLFEKAVAEVKEDYESRYGVSHVVRFSYQDKETDTVAMGSDGKPFVKEDGSILFRPAGHGALIRNLDALDEELVSIKNIDNVSARYADVTCEWKKVLMGCALRLKDRIFDYLYTLDQLTDVRRSISDFSYIPAYVLNVDDPYATEECQQLCNEIEEFLRSELCITIPQPKDCRDRAELLRKKLNRPIRVCGMVKNEGEPGGGPFIIRDRDGATSLQILEAAQIDPDDEKAQNALKSSTHFNPVDIVCCLRDYRGEKFRLADFVDEETGLVSSKSYQGRELRALELPGLWNGSMSGWNTLFVEVPAETFNPVKTVLDLLRPAHQ